MSGKLLIFLLDPLLWYAIYTLPAYTADEHFYTVITLIPNFKRFSFTVQIKGSYYKGELFNC